MATERLEINEQRPELEPALIDAETAAAICDISPALWHRLYASGRIGVRKIRLSTKCVKYSLQELREWCRSGCPSRREWLELELEGKA